MQASVCRYSVLVNVCLIYANAVMKEHRFKEEREKGWLGSLTIKTAVLVDLSVLVMHEIRRCWEHGLYKAITGLDRALCRRTVYV